MGSSVRSNWFPWRWAYIYDSNSLLDTPAATVSIGVAWSCYYPILRDLFQREREAVSLIKFGLARISILFEAMLTDELLVRPKHAKSWWHLVSLAFMKDARRKINKPLLLGGARRNTTPVNLRSPVTMNFANIVFA